MQRATFVPTCSQSRNCQTRSKRCAASCIWLYRVMRTNAEIGTFFSGFWERSVHNAAVRKITHLRYEEWIKRVSRLIRRAMEEGIVNPEIDVLIAARAAVALIDGIAIQVMRSGRPPTTQQQRQMVDIWIQSWLPPPGPLHIRAKAKLPGA